MTGIYFPIGLKESPLLSMMEIPFPPPMLTWQYDCLNCGVRFDVAVPKGPREEAAIACARCHDKHIRRIQIESSPSACGG